MEFVRIFKELGGSEKLTGLLMTAGANCEQLKIRMLICFQTLTSGENQEILAELSDLGLIHLLLNMLVATFKESGPQAASLLGILMSLLTNLSLND